LLSEQMKNEIGLNFGTREINEWKKCDWCDQMDSRKEKLCWIETIKQWNLSRRRQNDPSSILYHVIGECSICISITGITN
ncbi:hypothetical protein DERP_001683, partial [Dermatophagoides pteronyssinus]